MKLQHQRQQATTIEKKTSQQQHSLSQIRVYVPTGIYAASIIEKVQVKFQ